MNIKISLPGFKKNSTIEQFISTRYLEDQGIFLSINENSDLNFDFWFVIEELNQNQETAKVKSGNIIYLTAEVAHPSLYFDNPQLERFLNQFSKIFTCYPIFHTNVSNTLPFLPWMINANHGDSIFSPTARDHKWLETYKIKKQRGNKVSVFCSNQLSTPDHKIRYMFVNQLKKWFGENLIWYGNGVNRVEDKWDAITENKYHLVLENQSRYNVITEKLYDAYLGLSYPIYYGAPNVHDYFDENSLTTINIYDLKNSIKKIANIIESDAWESNQDLLIIQKDKVLNELNFINRICTIANLENNSSLLNNYECVTLNCSKFFKNPFKVKSTDDILFTFERLINFILRKIEIKRFKTRN